MSASRYELESRSRPAEAAEAGEHELAEPLLARLAWRDGVTHVAGEYPQLARARHDGQVAAAALRLVRRRLQQEQPAQRRRGGSGGGGSGSSGGIGGIAAVGLVAGRNVVNEGPSYVESMRVQRVAVVHVVDAEPAGEAPLQRHATGVHGVLAAHALPVEGAHGGQDHLGEQRVVPDRLVLDDLRTPEVRSDASRLSCTLSASALDASSTNRCTGEDREPSFSGGRSGSIIRSCSLNPGVLSRVQCTLSCCGAAPSSYSAFGRTARTCGESSTGSGCSTIPSRHLGLGTGGFDGAGTHTHDRGTASGVGKVCRWFPNRVSSKT
eukprot:scaffold54024_cov72-Phaeocystis_antarctica.AAC.3